MDFIGISNIHNKSTNKELSIKLLIDTESQKVCFAEASNDVVEFLSCLLCLPLSTIAKVLTKDRMVGSIGNLHDSVQDLDAKYIFSNQSKEHYLKPTMLDPTVFCPLQRLLDGPSLNVNTNFFTCEGKSDPINRIHISCCGYFTAIKDTKCPYCTKPMNQMVLHVPVTGVVVGTATYIVKDDLSVTPAASVLSSIALLVQCGVRDLTTLQEMTVKIGKEEALEILLASLKSSTVLTDVFLKNKKVGCKKETAA